MIISCNECDSSFNVDDNLIAETGSKVRCSKCNSIFMAYPQALETDEGDDLDLEDINASMVELENDDESFEVEGLTDNLSDELELDLDDFDDGLEAAGLSNDSGSELEFDLDLNDANDSDLDMPEDAVDGDELPDLGDFEDMAGLDDDTLALDDTDEGLEALDLDLNAETESNEIDFELDDDPELDLADLDLEIEAETLANAGEAGADELDLSDLAEIIDSDDPRTAADAGADAIEDLELDLDLDTDAGAQTADAGGSAEGDNELDLSDLEQMLETDDAPAADDVGDELNLQFDIDEQPAAEGADASAAADISEIAQDDDFLDIEKMLEDGDDATPDMEPADEDLSLTMEAAIDDPAKSAEDDLDLDFDIESELQENEDLLDSHASTNDPLESNLLDADDVVFLGDTGIEDESQPAEVMTDESATDEFSNTQGDYGATGVLPVDDEKVPVTPAVKPTRSRSKKPVFAVLLLLILALGVIIIPRSLGIKIPYISDIQIPYLSDLDLKIPYLSDWLNPEEQDVAGNLRIAPMARTITAKFVNNAKAGRLFVIRGKIKNEYDHPRSFVAVTGKLYRGGEKIVKKSTVYIGNVISKSDLSGMDIAAINKRMKNKFGDKRSNLKIKSGKVVPFMIVFDKLPNNLDEYTVEVASSSI